MKIHTSTKAGDRIFDIPETLIDTVRDAASQTDLTEHRWRLNAERIVSAFYGPAPETEPELTVYLSRVQGRGSGDLSAWAGIKEMLLALHPSAGKLAELQVAAAVPVSTEDSLKAKADRKKLAQRISSMAIMTRTRIVKYYLDARGYLVKRPKAAKPSVHDMVLKACAPFEKIAANGIDRTPQEKTLAYLVVTVLHTAVGEQVAAPTERQAANMLVPLDLRANVPKPATQPTQAN